MEGTDKTNNSNHINNSDISDNSQNTGHINNSENQNYTHNPNPTDNNKGSSDKTKSKWKIIDLLKSIKFWTIFGALATATGTLIAIINIQKEKTVHITNNENLTHSNPDTFDFYIGYDTLKLKESVILYYYLPEYYERGFLKFHFQFI